MHLILTGATGLVGSAVLDAMIKTKDVTKISIISRRPVRMAEDARDPRINVIIHKDFEKYDKNLLEQLKGATGVVWALGISQNAVSKLEYVKITKDFALAAAEAFQRIPREGAEPFNFVYISGDGTTLEPGMFTPLFSRVKGETEIALSEMRKKNPLFHANTVRLGFIDPATHATIKPYIPNLPMLMTTIAVVLGPLIRVAAKGLWSPTQPVGDFLTGMAMGRWEDKFEGPGFQKLGHFSVVQNVGFRRLMRLDEA